MADDKNKRSSANRIKENDRMKFIGFEVFPGKTKDLFKSDAEKDKYVKNLHAKRASGEIIREDCTLFEERVSMMDRITLIIACLFIFGALFVPWYGVYNEIEETVSKTPDHQAAEAEKTDSTALTMAADSMAGDSLAGMTAVVDTALSAAAATENSGPEVASQQVGTSEEVIHGYIAKKKFRKEYSRVTGLGSLISIDTVGGELFSSGFVLILTGIIFLIYTLLCIALPAYTLYGLFGLKGSEDDKSLKLKKILKYNWLPLILFSAALIFSFFGAEYSFDAASTFSSFGDSYGIGVFLDTISWGIILTLGASILAAVKGVEI